MWGQVGLVFVFRLALRILVLNRLASYAAAGSNRFTVIRTTMILGTN